MTGMTVSEYNEAESRKIAILEALSSCIGEPTTGVAGNTVHVTVEKILDSSKIDKLNEDIKKGNKSHDENRESTSKQNETIIRILRENNILGEKILKEEVKAQEKKDNDSTSILEDIAKNFPMLGKIGNVLSKGLKALYDIQVKNINDYRKIISGGVFYNKDLRQLHLDAAYLGIRSDELRDAYIKNSQNIARLTSVTGDGTGSFVKLLRSVKDVSNEIGMNFTDSVEIASYMIKNTFDRFDNTTESFNRLSKETQEYQKFLQKLSFATGKSADSIIKEQEARDKEASHRVWASDKRNRPIEAFLTSIGASTDLINAFVTGVPNQAFANMALNPETGRIMQELMNLNLNKNNMTMEDMTRRISELISSKNDAVLDQVRKTPLAVIANNKSVSDVTNTSLNLEELSSEAFFKSLNKEDTDRFKTISKAEEVKNSVIENTVAALSADTKQLNTVVETMKPAVDSFKKAMDGVTEFLEKHDLFAILNEIKWVLGGILAAVAAKDAYNAYELIREGIDLYEDYKSGSKGKNKGKRSKPKTKGKRPPRVGKRPPRVGKFGLLALLAGGAFGAFGSDSADSDELDYTDFDIYERPDEQLEIESGKNKGKKSKTKPKGKKPPKVGKSVKLAGKAGNAEKLAGKALKLTKKAGIIGELAGTGLDIYEIASSEQQSQIAAANLLQERKEHLFESKLDYIDPRAYVLLVNGDEVGGWIGDKIGDGMTAVSRWRNKDKGKLTPEEALKVLEEFHKTHKVSANTTKSKEDVKNLLELRNKYKNELLKAYKVDKDYLEGNYISKVTNGFDPKTKSYSIGSSYSHDFGGDLSKANEDYGKRIDIMKKLGVTPDRLSQFRDYIQENMKTTDDWWKLSGIIESIKRVDGRIGSAFEEIAQDEGIYDDWILENLSEGKNDKFNPEEGLKKILPAMYQFYKLDDPDYVLKRGQKIVKLPNSNDVLNMNNASIIPATSVSNAIQNPQNMFSLNQLQSSYNTNNNNDNQSNKFDDLINSINKLQKSVNENNEVLNGILQNTFETSRNTKEIASNSVDLDNSYQ